MKRKKFNIEYQKRIYSGKYKTIISQENVKTLLVEPELEEDKSEFKINYIDNINTDNEVKKRKYFVQKFLLDLLTEINVKKIKIDNKNENIIKYWLKYVKDFKADEMNEVKIAEDSLYRKLQLKKNLFVDILENNNKKELLLLDNEISPAKLGIRSEFTESLLDKLIKNINNESKDIKRLTIGIVNDVDCIIKDNLVSRIKDLNNVILLNDCNDKKFLKDNYLSRFDHIISVNFLHQIEDVESFFKTSKLMLKRNGKIHVIDFGKMDPISVLTAIFFQEKNLDVETEKRTQFFYKVDYIKKIAKKYFFKNTMFLIENNIAYYLESENYTDHIELINNLENEIGLDFDKKIVLLSLDSFNVDVSDKTTIKEQLKNYNENLEEILKIIWMQNLDIDDVDRNSNYFKLGGNSLSATKLLVEIERRLKCKFTLNEIFSNPEFEKMLNLINSKQLGMEVVEGEI
ncbi:TPA: hypothetical protein KPF36_001968 [Clostridioides difficile]|nr:hypothetical protein [Clostridioides difficile]